MTFCPGKVLNQGSDRYQLCWGSKRYARGQTAMPGCHTIQLGSTDHENRTGAIQIFHWVLMRGLTSQQLEHRERES